MSSNFAGDVAQAVPFFAAAFAQVFSSLIGRVSASISKAHLERMDRAEVVPADEAQLPPSRRPKRTYSQMWTDAYNPQKISAIYAKNSDGAAALIGAVSLLVVFIGSGLLQINAYGLLVLITLVIGSGVAVNYWFKDVEKYKGRRIAGFSQTVFFVAVADILVGVLLIVLPHIPAASGISDLFVGPARSATP